MYQKLRFFLRIIGIIGMLFIALPVFSQVVARNDTISCDGTSNLYATPAGGIWSTTGGATIVNPSSKSTQVTGLDAGINQFTYTVSGMGSDLVIITNNQVFSNAGADPLPSCLSTASLSGSPIPPSGTGLWTLKYPTPGVIISTPSTNNSSISNLPFGNTIFVWTISKNGCTATDEVSVNSNLPENNDGTDQSGCTNTFSIDAEAIPATGTGVWTQVSSPGTVVFTNTSIPGIQITAPIGQSRVRWSISYQGCTSTKDFVIKNNLPNPQAGNNQQLCSSTATLAAAPLQFSENGTWSIVAPQGEIISNPNIINPTVSNLKRGTTTLVWSINNGLCISSDSIQIVNNLPNANAGRDTSICTSTYILLANNPGTETGTWTCSNPGVVIHNPNSYNSTVSNLGSEIYTFTFTVSNGLCSTNDIAIVNSHFVPITAGLSSEGCSSSIGLNATQIPPGGSGFWTIVSGSTNIDNSLSNITVARNIVQNIKLRWTILSGTCSYTNEIEYYNHMPTQALTESDKTICNINTTLIANQPSGLNNETGVWTVEVGPGTIVIENPSLFQTPVTNLDLGLNIFKWTITNGMCTTFDLLSITNNKISTNAGVDESICSKSYTLNSQNEGGTGYWTTSSSTAIIANSTQANSPVSNLSFGIHTFTWTRFDHGCSANDNVTITNNLPSDVNAGFDQTVCDSVASLNGNSPAFGSGVWARSVGTGKISSPNQSQTSVYELNPGLNTFRWTISYAACSVYDEVNIYNHKINLTAGPDQTICNTNSASISATAPGAGQTGLWTIAGGSGNIVSPSSTTTAVTNIIKGINTFKWTLTDGYCTNSDQITITNNTPDSAKVSADKIICTDQTTINAVAVSIGTGKWSISQGNGVILNQANYNTSASAISPGVNIFTWTVTKNGCSLSANQQITNNKVSAVIPNDVLQVCKVSNDTTLVAIEPSGSGTWGVWTKVSLGSATIESPSNYTTKVSSLANGELRFRWTVQNANCSNFDEIRVINDYYAATAWPVGSPQFCNNYTSVLGNTGPGSASTQWTSSNPAITFSNPNNSSTTVQNIPLGPSTVFWTITNNGCASTASLLLTNNSVFTEAGQNIFVCGPETNISAQALQTGQTGYWSANNVAVIFANSLSPATAVSNAPAGNSTLTWTINANGCSASDFLVLTNNSFNVTAGNDRIICGTSSNLMGSNPLSGTGLWTLISGNADIITPSVPETNITNVSNGVNTFRWTVIRSGCTATDDVNITNNLYVANVLPSPDVCTDTAQIQAVAIPAGSGATGVWTTLAGGGTFDNNLALQTIVRHMAIGINQIRWTVSKGTCISYKNLSINNNDLKVDAGPDQTTCDSWANIYATPLSATGTGFWTGPQGVTIATPSNSGTMITNLSRGQNTFTWSASDKGCVSSDMMKITLNSFDANSGEDQMVLVPNTVLNASLPGVTATGVWQVLTGHGTFNDITNPTSSVSDLIMGSNQYRWDVTWNGCSAHDDITIIYNVAESHAGIDQNICATSTTLTAETPIFGTGTWTVTQGAGTFQNANLPTSVVTNIAKGTNIYRWTVNAYGVLAYDEVSISNNTYIISAGPDQNTCNSFINLSGDEPGAGGSGSWHIIQGNGSFTNNSIYNPSVTNISVGTNKYVWEINRNGCNTSDTVSILRYPTPTVANAGADVTLCNNTQYFLQGSIPTSGTGLWTAENSQNVLQNKSNFNTWVTNLGFGPNNLRWTISTQYCQSTDLVVISSYNTLAITKQPLSQNISQNGNAVFIVETSGGAKSYQWKKNGQNITDDSHYSGSTTNTLTINNLSTDDQATYTCTIQGYCNTLTSNSANLGIVITGIEDVVNTNFKVYPNPSSGMLSIDFDKNLDASNLIVLNLNGQVIFSKPKINQKETIDLSKFDDGIYMLYLTVDKVLIKTKIVIQK